MCSTCWSHCIVTITLWNFYPYFTGQETGTGSFHTFSNVTEIICTKHCECKEKTGRVREQDTHLNIPVGSGHTLSLNDPCLLLNWASSSLFSIVWLLLWRENILTFWYELCIQTLDTWDGKEGRAWRGRGHSWFSQGHIWSNGFKAAVNKMAHRGWEIVGKLDLSFYYFHYTLWSRGLSYWWHTIRTVSVISDSKPNQNILSQKGF